MRAFILTLTLLISSSVFLHAQQEEKSSGAKIPNTTVKTLDGQSVNTSEFQNDGKPYIVSFWATWCKPCLKELNAINEVYEDWQEETGMKLIAISIDDARASARVRPMVAGSSWDYEVYLDANQDFKRAMGVTDVPHTFIIDGDNNIVWQSRSYVDGNEGHLIELIKKLIAGEDISKEK